MDRISAIVIPVMSLELLSGVLIFFYHPKGIDYFLIELNSVPGMTETSLVPKSSHLSGISYLELLESIMDQALAKKALFL